MELEARNLVKKQKEIEDWLQELEDKTIYESYLKYKEFKADYMIAKDERYKDIMTDTSTVKLMHLLKDYRESEIDISNINEAKKRVMQYQKYIKYVPNMDLTDISDKKTRAAVCDIIRRENTGIDFDQRTMDIISIIENLELGDAIIEVLKGNSTPSAAIQQHNVDTKDYIEAVKRVEAGRNDKDVEKFWNNYYNLHDRKPAPNIIFVSSVINNIEINETYQILQDLGLVERDISQYKILKKEDIDKEKSSEESNGKVEIDIKLSRAAEDLLFMKAKEEEAREKAKQLSEMNLKVNPNLKDGQDEFDKIVENSLFITKSENEMREEIRMKNEEQKKKKIIERISNMTKEDEIKVEGDIDFIDSNASDDVSKEDDEIEL